jgi:hypothetical protein
LAESGDAAVAEAPLVVGVGLLFSVFSKVSNFVDHIKSSAARRFFASLRLLVSSENWIVFLPSFLTRCAGRGGDSRKHRRVCRDDV